MKSSPLSPRSVSIDESDETVSSLPSQPSKKQPAPPWIHLIAGGIGGSIAAFVTCPLDVVKTRMQAMNKQQLTGTPSQMKDRRFGIQTWSTLKFIHQKEGVPGLWRGIGPNLVGILPSRAIYFYTYALCKQSAFQQVLADDSPWVHVVSAVVAGVTVCIDRAEQMRGGGPFMLE